MADEVEETKTVAEVWSGAFAWILARLLVAFMLFLPFALGCFVGGVALHDPDTCWLLALGRYIFEHHALPSTDPFSFTFAMRPGTPFVMYQWLSELVFYCAYKINGLPSLLAFAALVLGQSFLVFPMRLASRFSPVCLASLLTITGVFASCFHYLVRPEIMSYIFMSFTLVLLRRIYSAKDTEPVQWLTVGAFTVLMLAWANAHSAFVLGLILEFVILLVTRLQSMVQKSPFPGSSKSALFALIGSFLATFINPYGIGLWSYLPGLFFAKFNYRIAELRPIRFSDLNDFTYYPFVFLVILSLWIIFNAFRYSREAGRTVKWSNLVIIAICIYYGFTTRRIIPFSVLMMISQVSELWLPKPVAQNSDAVRKSSFYAAFEKNLEGIFNPTTLVWPITVAVLSLAGCWFTFSKVVSPMIPQGSKAFSPPVKIIDFLHTSKQTGNVLNDAQFGDMLIWYAPEIPVFIDTRYDMHGEPMVADYVTMISATGDWRALLDRYKIDWVFVPPSANLLRELKADSLWSIEREDDTAAIMRRTRPPKAKQP